MILEIVQLGDPVLREQCVAIEEITDDISRLVEDMLETMYYAHGVGLAAPQIGLALRLAVIDVSHDPECVSYLKINGEDLDVMDCMPLVVINPELHLEGPRVIETEGCLSIRGVRAPVGRPALVRATFQMLDGQKVELETDGLLARAFQHEIDHLNGVLFIDRLSPAAKMAIRKQMPSIEQ